MPCHSCDDETTTRQHIVKSERVIAAGIIAVKADDMAVKIGEDKRHIGVYW